MSEKKQCSDCGRNCADPQVCEDCGLAYCQDCYDGHRMKIVMDSNTGEFAEVELHDAFIWDCDLCGKENLIRIVRGGAKHKLDDDHLAELRQQLELEEWQEIPQEALDSVIAVPEHVTCSHCNAIFAAQMPDFLESLQADDDDDEDDPADHWKKGGSND